MALFVARLLVVAALAAGLLTGCATTAPPSGPAPVSGTSHPPFVPVPRPSHATATTGSAAGVRFDDQPLWPFHDPADAARWQAAYRSGGQQPWHLDAAASALAFTQGYLGFRGVDTVVSRQIGQEAEIGVGFARPGGGTGTAAVVHLVRIGTGADAPWEVVGTRDSVLTLTTPAYAARVTSPVRAGGRITGVDESVRLDVRELSTTTPLGTSCCLSTGGQDAPWSATVPYRRPTDPVVTLVASTGGHVADVELFAVTGVRTR
jgi:hypothetical protein